MRVVCSPSSGDEGRAPITVVEVEVVIEVVVVVVVVVMSGDVSSASLRGLDSCVPFSSLDLIAIEERRLVSEE